LARSSAAAAADARGTRQPCWRPSGSCAPLYERFADLDQSGAGGPWNALLQAAQRA